jgi:hypothetical protein
MAFPPWVVRGVALRQRWLFARPYVIEREGFGQGGECGGREGKGPRSSMGEASLAWSDLRRAEIVAKAAASRRTPYAARLGAIFWNFRGLGAEYVTRVAPGRPIV